LLVFENIAGEPKILFNYHFYQPWGVSSLSVFFLPELCMRRA
jgi:hypothetical protein